MSIYNTESWWIKIPVQEKNNIDLEAYLPFPNQEDSEYNSLGEILKAIEAANTIIMKPVIPLLG